MIHPHKAALLGQTFGKYHFLLTARLETHKKGKCKAGPSGELIPEDTDLNQEQQQATPETAQTTSTEMKEHPIWLPPTYEEWQRDRWLLRVNPITCSPEQSDETSSEESEDEERRRADTPVLPNVQTLARSIETDLIQPISTLMWQAQGNENMKQEPGLPVHRDTTFRPNQGSEYPACTTQDPWKQWLRWRSVGSEAHSEQLFQDWLDKYVKAIVLVH